MNTYVPIFRSLDARGDRKLRTDKQRDNYCPRCAHARRGLITLGNQLESWIYNYAIYKHYRNAEHKLTAMIHNMNELTRRVSGGSDSVKITSLLRYAGPIPNLILFI